MYHVTGRADLANQRHFAVLHSHGLLAPLGKGQGLVQGVC